MLSNFSAEPGCPVKSIAGSVEGFRIVETSRSTFDVVVSATGTGRITPIGRPQPANRHIRIAALITDIFKHALGRVLAPAKSLSPMRATIRWGQFLRLQS